PLAAPRHRPYARSSRMLQLLLRIALGGALAGAALANLAAPGHSRDALATFGLSRPRMRVVALAAIVCLELGLAAGVIAGVSPAVYAAAAPQLCLAAVLLWALRRGRHGAPCGCFGPRSRVGPAAVVRNVVLFGGFATILLLPGGQ